MGYQTPNIDRVAKKKASHSPTSTVSEELHPPDVQRSSADRTRSAPD